jgi:hypothetical protein
MNHGDTIAFVERNPARYGKHIDLADAERFLADPIEFSQNIARLLSLGTLHELLMEDVPRQVEDQCAQLEYMVETAHRRKDVPAATAAFDKYTDVVRGGLSEAREYGVAMGAVMEQLRIGLLRIVDLKNRGLTSYDMSILNDLQKLRQEHNLRSTSGHEDTDLAKAEKRDRE